MKKDTISKTYVNGEYHLFSRLLKLIRLPQTNMLKRTSTGGANSLLGGEVVPTPYLSSLAVVPVLTYNGAGTTSILLSNIVVRMEAKAHPFRTRLRYRDSFYGPGATLPKNESLCSLLPTEKSSDCGDVIAVAKGQAK
jgi:hypothetical protein